MTMPSGPDFNPGRGPLRVAIVGAGFSGAATAVQLLRRPPPQGVRVVLVNESGRMARGLAYGTRSSEHILNVPAGNMSALADDPDDFLRYARGVDPGVAPGSFVPRSLYGAYLESLLSSAERQAGGGGAASLERVVGRVNGARLGGGGAPTTLLLEDGASIEADKVVLAFGHFPPADPLPPADMAQAGDRYVRDPWRAGALGGIGPQDDVLLLGSGLTAVDVALALCGQGHRGRLLSVSRRGLQPQSHRSAGAAPGAWDAAPLVQAMGATLRQQVRALRRQVAQAMAVGEDWRDVIGALRPHTAALWQRLSPADKARFLRHLRAHWDALRHRCAPAAYETYRRLVDDGQLQVRAARVAGLRGDSSGLEVLLRPRGEGLESVRVRYLVNCTGPSTDLRRCPSGLVRGLLDDGLLCADALGLGLEVGDDYAVRDRAGRPSATLFYIGPLLKARYWEATAVPELRVHARRLARLLAGQEPASSSPSSVA